MNRLRPIQERNFLRTKAGLVGGLVLKLTLSGCSAEESEDVKPEVTQQAGSGMDCSYSESNPLSPVEPGKAKVHGYCHNDPHGAVGIYQEAVFTGGTQIGKVKNDTVVDIICADPEGEPIQDAMGVGAADGSESDPHDSYKWIKIRTPDGQEGLIAEAWLGFTKDGAAEDCPTA